MIFRTQKSTPKRFEWILLPNYPFGGEFKQTTELKCTELSHGIKLVDLSLLPIKLQRLSPPMLSRSHYNPRIQSQMVIKHGLFEEWIRKWVPNHGHRYPRSGLGEISEELHR